ncbi:MAG: CGNR zinc finger domain-containing protein [Clostridia bacterium]|nr:CGNR zinc finger domain-containing protein [Clostridia bacterium]
MKAIPTEYYTFTEIGGVGEMIYKAVRFPEYVSEYSDVEKEDIIVPLFSVSHRPEIGVDYTLTGQDLLASLCNLYKRINAPDSAERITDLVLSWCRNNIHPYNIDKLCEEIENGDFTDADFHDYLKYYASFSVRDFVSDLCKIGAAYEYYDALQKVKYQKDAATGRTFYYEGRACDSMPFLEKYKEYTDDSEYLKHFNADYDKRVFDLLEMFPDFTMRVKQNPKTHKMELCADLYSVFDIAWYTFARMVSDVAPPIDDDLNLDYEFSEGSILTCMACGNYFVRRSSRQRYCNNPDCQAERNNRKARAYYKRKKIEN